jgi:hypothetical protein
MKYPFIRWAMRRPEIIIPVFFLSINHTVAGQDSFPDARSIGLGKISAVCEAEEFVPQNPALLGYSEKNIFNIGHTRPFIMKEIGISSLACVVKAAPGSFRFSLSNYGIKGYRNYCAGIGYGMILSEKLTAGIIFNYSGKIISNNWNYLWSFSPGAGIHYKISSGTAIGILLHNPLSLNNYSDYGPVLPSCLSVGISHQIYSNTKCYSEFTYSSYENIGIKAGVTWLLHPDFYLRSGYHSDPHAISFGTGWRVKNMVVDFSVEWSAIPGITPSILFTYYPKK